MALSRPLARRAVRATTVEDAPLPRLGDSARRRLGSLYRALVQHARYGVLADASMYAAAALAPLGIITWLMRLWQVSFSIPFASNGDAVSVQAMVKGLFETGSYLAHPALGAPGIARFSICGHRLPSVRIFPWSRASWASERGQR